MLSPAVRFARRPFLRVCYAGCLSSASVCMSPSGEAPITWTPCFCVHRRRLVTFVRTRGNPNIAPMLARTACGPRSHTGALGHWALKITLPPLTV